ncbi:MAG: D-alanyl-D-alanine carboxypeptidase/D-alanyl-D-alanine-endopeptidase [Verrucomicrobiota bacterium]
MISVLTFLLLTIDATPLDQFRASPHLKTATIGFSLIPLEDPKPTTIPKTETHEPSSASPPPQETKPPTLEHNPHKALIPASVQKALTTATALHLLGPDFTFQTRLYQSGQNLIILGGGDPLLASTNLNVEFPAWHQALLDAGLTEISGTLIADPSRFEDRTTPNQWLWGDLGNYYGAGPSGLNFHRNQYTLTFAPGPIGSPARLLSTIPKPPGVTFDNHIRTGPSGSGDQGYVYGGPRRTLITLRGTIPTGDNFQIKGALPDPPLLCLHAFKDYLEENNFPVANIKVQRNADRIDETLLHTTTSPTLAKLIIPTNQKSINLNADSIFKALTPRGTTTASTQAFRKLWQSKGLDLTGLDLHDGSGLSPQNLVTPAQITAILKATANSEHRDPFTRSLAVAGRSGTLRSFGRGTACENRIIAKTGSMTRVRSFAGYLRAKSGKKFAFALLINHYNGPDKTIRPLTTNLLAQLIVQN